MKLHKVSSLEPSRISQIRSMVNICTEHDKTSVSFPFDEAELFLFIEHGSAVISAIAFVPVEKQLYECSAFTHPDFRGQGFFTDLLEAGIEALPEDSELLFYTDRKDKNTAAVLDSIGTELDSEEHMMELLPEDFFATANSSDCFGTSNAHANSIIDIHTESLDIDGTPTIRFYSDHAVVSFSVFPSHYYLYGFEVDENCRGMGYGTRFLSTVLARFRHPVLLQVAGDNAPALALYKKTGFRITETLCCYLY